MNICSQKRLCDNEECQLCYNRSFASHEKAQFWSKTNGDISPRQVFKSSDTKYLFDCDKCEHDFWSRLNDITKYNGTWCPFCSNPSKKLCENVDCQVCYDRSFASHEKAQFWSLKNEKTPRQIFKSSNT